MSATFEKILYSNGIFLTVNRFIESSGKKSFKFSDLKKLFSEELDLSFSEKIYKYGIARGYFPPGAQESAGKTRFYSIEDLYIITSAMILKNYIGSEFKRVIKHHDLEDSRTALKFLKFLDHSRNLDAVTNIRNIPDKTERLARSLHFYLINKITREEFLKITTEEEQTIEDNYDLVLVDEQLTLLGEKMYDFYKAEKEKIIEELRIRMKGNK